MPFPWGPLISAGGSILGGILGGGGNKGPSFGDQKSWMREQMMSKIKWTVDDAKRSGIHPLVALGSQAAGGFASPVGGYDAGGFGWGDAVARGLEAAGELYAQDQDRLERDEERKYQRGLDDDRRFNEILERQSQIKRDDQALKESNARIAEHMANAAAATARANAIGATGPVNELVGPNSMVGPTLKLPLLGNIQRRGVAAAQDIENEWGEAADPLSFWSLLGHAWDQKISPYIPEWSVPPVWRLMQKGYRRLRGEE